MDDKQQLRFHQAFSMIRIPSKLEGKVQDLNYEIIETIESISRVNLFVGSNNSGKSLLLRNLVNDAAFVVCLDSKAIDEVNRERELYINQLATYLHEFNYRELSNNGTVVLSDEILNKLNCDLENGNIALYKKQLKSLFNTTLGLDPGRGVSRSNSYTHLSSNQIERYRIEVAKLGDWIEGLIERYSVNKDFKRIYCSTIRTLRKYDSSDMLQHKTRKEYGFKKEIHIANGQDMFDLFFKMVNGLEGERRKKKSFEKFLSKYFFDNSHVELSPVADIKELTIKIGEEKERPVYDLGEGLQMLIIMSFPLFYYDAAVYVIEEPEIFLHPGLQRKFMEVICDPTINDNFLFFISTHSNHILEAVNFQDDISVYSVRKILPEGDSISKEASFQVVNMANSESDLLVDLGVQNTSVFLSNTTIWVEGVTDMIYFRRFFEVFLEKRSEDDQEFRMVKEGVDFSFILSGGSNITHFNFSEESDLDELRNKVVVSNICGKSFVIVDSDNGKNSTRKQKLFEDLNGRFRVLKYKEVENSLSNSVLVNTVREFPSCRDLIIPESNLLKHTQYRKKGIGNYIENFILKGVKGTRKHFSVKPTKSNSTINCKVEFARKALEFITYDELPDDIVQLLEELYEFVCKNSWIS